MCLPRRAFITTAALVVATSAAAAAADDALDRGGDGTSTNHISSLHLMFASWRNCESL